MHDLARLRIDLAYDGTEFHGWATQPKLRTVQETLQLALGTALRCEPPRLVVAGRTDTGVHARGQVAHCDVAPGIIEVSAGRATQPPLEALRHRLNGILPPDLRVGSVTEAPAGFDARFSASWRRYAYRIADTPEVVDPLLRRHVLTWPRPLDLDAMNEASAHLLGLKDFAAFCKKREGATTVRTLLRLDWGRDGDGIATGAVVADAFCHNMVRSLVGCLIAVGEGRRQPEWAATLQVAGVRDPAASVAPAHGLTLEEVGYPSDAELAEQALLTRRKRSLDD